MSCGKTMPLTNKFLMAVVALTTASQTSRCTLPKGSIRWHMRWPNRMHSSAVEFPMSTHFSYNATKSVHNSQVLLPLAPFKSTIWPVCGCSTSSPRVDGSSATTTTTYRTDFMEGVAVVRTM